MVAHQVHDKFKVFVGSSLEEVAAKVEAFTSTGSFAAKSVGVEFVDSSKSFLLSLGYAEGQAGYAIKLHQSVVGTLPESDEASELCAALEAAAANAGDVICHELYVDADSVVHIVLMVRA